MFFGLFNALASFYGYINKIWAEKFNIFVIVYLDNIVIYTKDSSYSYVSAIWQSLKIFQKYNLFANLNKYYFYQNKVRFLSFNVSSKKICKKNKKIKVVKNWFKPKLI